MADVIPVARRGLWSGGVVGIPGGIDQYRDGGINARGAAGGHTTIDVTQAPYNADPTGVSDAKTAIEAACNAAQDGDVVYLPDGEYRLNSGIGPSSVSQAAGWRQFTIRGAGPDATIIKNYYTGDGSAISVFTSNNDVEFPGPYMSLVGDYSQGDTVLTLDNTADIEGYEGYICHISMENNIDPDTGMVVAVKGYERVQTCKAKIVSISPTSGGSSTVTISPGLAFDVPGSLNPRISKLRRFTQLVGVEDLQIDGANTGTNNSPMINFGQTIECWMYNVKVRNAANYLAGLQIAVNCEIRHCDFRTRIGEGTSGAGLLIANASNCLVTDTIITDIFPGVESNFGVTNTVFSYNCIVNNANAGLMGASLDTNHGAHNTFNLSEGNFLHVFQSDGYHGSESNGTVFRNLITGYDPANSSGRWALRLQRFSWFFNVVANIVGKTGLGVGFWKYATCGEDFLKTSSTSIDLSTIVPGTSNPESYVDMTLSSSTAYESGTRVLVQSRGTPTAYFSGWLSDNMTGNVANIKVFRVEGTGTHNDWDLVGIQGYGSPILFAFCGPFMGAGGPSIGVWPNVASPRRGVWWRCWDGTPFTRLGNFNSTGPITGCTISASTDTITKASHPFITGDPIAFSSLTGGSGLSTGTRYFVIKLTSSTFKLASSYANAVAGTALNIISSDYSDATAAVAYQVGDVVEHISTGPGYLSGSDTILAWQAVNAAKNLASTWDTPGPAQTDWSPISQLSFQDMDADVYDTLIWKGNASPNAGDTAMAVPTSQNLGVGETYPDSYYLDEKPDWFGSLAFPPFDPASPTEDPTAIPAGWRYINGNEDYLNSVATPSFSPLPGTFSEAQSVAITCSTPGATMRYTIDNSDPSPSHGTVYSTPVSIPSTTVLKAIAYATGLDDSPIQSGTYTIIPPTDVVLEITGNFSVGVLRLGG